MRSPVMPPNVTTVPAKPTMRVSRAALSPPMEFNASFGKFGFPPTISTIFLIESFSSGKTASAPSRFKIGSHFSTLRTSETVRRPSACAICTRHCPSAELPAFCKTQSPGRSSTKSCRIRQTVGGLMNAIVASSAGMSAGTRSASAAGTLIAPRHTPASSGMRTRSPTANPRTFAPTAATRPTPSRPATAGNARKRPYVPPIMPMSDGCTTAASSSTRISSACGAGTSISRSLSTSSGFPVSS